MQFDDEACARIVDNFHENQKLSVNISRGPTMATETDIMDSLLKRADILLYESKTKGRSRSTLGCESRSLL